MTPPLDVQRPGTQKAKRWQLRYFHAMTQLRRRLKESHVHEIGGFGCTMLCSRERSLARPGDVGCASPTHQLERSHRSPPWAPSHNRFKELAAATPQGTIRIPQSRIPSMEHYLSAERVTVAHKRKCFWPARCPSRRSVNAFSPSGPSACTCDDVPDPKLFAVFTFVLARLRHQSACGAVVRTPPRGHACQAKFCWAPHAQ